jgi:hypothetical protein
MRRKTALLSVLLICAWVLSACHAVSVDDSQISIAKPVNEFVSKALGSAHEVIPSIAIPKTASKTMFYPMPKYSLQAGSPVYSAYFANTPDQCKWMGIAGQVFDANGKPVAGIKVIVTGTLNGALINQDGTTVSADDPKVLHTYGPSPYEIQVSSQPIDSQGTLAVQLVDANGNALSRKILVNTYQDCQKNLVLLNFIQVDYRYQYASTIIFHNAAVASSN